MAEVATCVPIDTAVIIVTCGCGSVPTQAQKIFSVLYPAIAPPPAPYISKKGYTLLETFPSDSEAYKFLSGVLRKKGRYGYIVEYNTQDFSLVSVYNTVKGQKVQ